jgi:adenylate cyclase
MPSEQKVTRKLRAIFSADVKGYSLLMTNDEASTIQTLKEYRKIMSEIIKQHSGRVVDAPGDNILAEFSSVVNAVQCSVEIQKELKEKNADLTEEKRLEFRIGVNIGDVVQDGASLYGEGVNIAARIEGLADSGGVCISRGAYDHLKNKLELGYEFIGEHSVKNIKDPVRIYKVLMDSKDVGKLIGDEPKPLLKPGTWATVIIAAFLLIFIGYQVFHKTVTPEFEPASIENMALPLPNKPSIAVLPFDNMSDNKEQVYFSDGITENIITAISKTNKLFVIARNSTFVYKGKPVKVKQIAEELGVRYVLEGSVQKSEDRVRITAQLIDAIGGHHLWAERYDRNLEDIFLLQDEITMKIVTAMRIELTDGEQARMWGDQHKNIDIFLKAMEGNKLYRAFTMETLQRYGQLGHEMIDIDPESPAGYLVRGWYNYRLALFGQSKNPKEYIAKAFKMAQKATSLDEYDPFAHILLGMIYSLRREYEKAISEGRRSIELFPNGAMPRGVFASLLCNADMADEALGHITQAIRLNPSPASWYYVTLGKCYRQKGEYEEALTAFKKALHINPKAKVNHMLLAMVYVLLDRQDEAEAAAKKVLEIDPNFSVKLTTKAWPYKNQVHLKLITDAMRKAGLPD